ncbi:hypothetical protein AAKU55_001466 [Oxalobacteraceae bacterium GrIS 1.11]
MFKLEQQFAKMIEVLARTSGIPFKLIGGNCAFFDTQGTHWQVSLGRDSNLIVIEANLGLAANMPGDIAAALLQMNREHQLMRGAAFAIDPERNDILLFKTMELPSSEAAALEQVLGNLIDIKNAATEKLQTVKHGVAGPQRSHRRIMLTLPQAPR